MPLSDLLPWRRPTHKKDNPKERASAIRARRDAALEAYLREHNLSFDDWERMGEEMFNDPEVQRQLREARGQPLIRYEPD